MLVAHYTKGGRCVMSRFNMLHSLMLPIVTEWSIKAGFRPNYGLVVSQLLKSTKGHIYLPMHQFGTHDARLEWNRAKSILDAEERVRLHSLKPQVLELEKIQTLNDLKMLCIITCILLCGRVVIPGLRNHNII